MSPLELLKKHGIKPNKNQKQKEAVENRAAEIVKEVVKSKGPSRNDLMLKAKAAGIKNFRILNKEELFQVLDHPEDAVSVVEKAVARMSKYGKVEFEKEVGKAYDILWKMFKSSLDGTSCNWDYEREQKLHSILNFIDDTMGWEG